MSKFDINDLDVLKESIYNSYAHDANLENIVYKFDNDNIKIEFLNKIFHIKTDLTLYDIGIVLAIKSELLERYDTIMSLTVEDDLSYLNDHLANHYKGNEGYIYLLIQMLSGSELHILCKEVSIEISH